MIYIYIYIYIYYVYTGVSWRYRGDIVGCGFAQVCPGLCPICPGLPGSVPGLPGFARVVLPGFVSGFARVCPGLPGFVSGSTNALATKRLSGRGNFA